MSYHNIKIPRGIMRYEKRFEVGDRVRVKPNKDKPEKSTEFQIGQAASTRSLLLVPGFVFVPAQ